MIGIVAGLVALANQVQDPVSAERLAVVLDPHRRGFGGAQGVDAEQVGQGAVVHGDGLGDLEEPDQLEAVQALGARLILVDLGEPGVDGRVAGDQAVDVGEPEEAPHRVHRGVDRGRHQPGLAEVADVELDVGALDADQRIHAVDFAPSRTSGGAGRRTTSGCGRSIGPSTKRPPAVAGSSGLAGTAEAPTAVDTEHLTPTTHAEAQPCSPPTQRGTRTHRS